MPENRMKQYWTYQPPRVAGSSEDFQEALAAQQQSSATALAYERGLETGIDQGREEMRVLLGKHHRAHVQRLEHRIQETWEESFAAGVVVTVAVMLCVMVFVSWWRM